MTAGGPHEEFLGPSWQRESSPLTRTKHVLKKATRCGAKISKIGQAPCGVQIRLVSLES